MDEYRRTPLFKKAEEIRELAEAIVESAPDAAKDKGDRYRNRMLEASKDDIVANAYTIGAKIAGAYGMDLYDLQMENACLIRRACREMVVALRGLEMGGHSEPAHFDLLRTAVEEFRPLFVEWVATFKESDRMWDDWGLFNLPGDVPDTD
jgi:single-stranded DNA-specific DHH superfamily exonuclease